MAKAPEKTHKAGKRSPLPTIEIEINRLDDEGMGIGRFEGKDVLVPQTLPGEKVLAAMEHEGRRITGRLLKVLTKSPDRVFSPCIQAGNCLGCPLILMSYCAQLRFKEDRVRRALRRYETLKTVKLHPIWEAPQPLGYRTTAKLAMGKERGRVKIGLYRRGTHEVVDIGDCPLHHPLINKIIQVVREEVERQEIFVYNPAKRRGLLRYLVIKVSPIFGKAMVTFVTAERNYREIIHLAKWLKKKVPEVISVHQNVNPSEGNVVFGRETLKMLGVPDLIDRVGDMRLRLSPTSFFQVNNEQAARIYEQVRRWANLTREQSAVDLYCGIGGIALHLAEDAGRVVGIEMVEEAVKNARENARMNGLTACTFRSGDAAELVQNLFMEIAPGNVAVVNPPRRGCDQKVLQALVKLAPRVLIYVSCNPQTLARDLDLLHSMGYRTLEVQPVDMFPQTPHVESVARLEPDPGKDKKQRARRPQKQQNRA
jgi:23S rRNA (uracil1939-C5)-methyltransferase